MIRFCLLTLSRYRYFTLFGGFILLFSSCESEFIPRNINLEPEYVVEGFIELAEPAVAPYVIITKSSPFYTTLNQDQLNNVFVKGARVVVASPGSASTSLQEFCLADLPPSQRLRITDRLGLNADSVTTNICVYTDISGRLVPEAGKAYSLTVQIDNKKLEAITTIPPSIPIDSLWWREAPGKPSDTLLQLMAILNDPVGVKNYYRYFCSVNGQPYSTPFNSVFDDQLIDGLKFEFRLTRPSVPGEGFDQASFGLFKIGDSVTIKWSTIDQGHYNFWNTYEFNRGNQGPFSTYTTINSNINGGLGVWGGYNSRAYKLKVKRG